MSVEPGDELMVPVDCILMASKPKRLSGFDIVSQIVDVEGFRRLEPVFGNGVVVNVRMGFANPDLVGKDAAIELFEDLVVFEEPLGMHAVRVGEED